MEDLKLAADFPGVGYDAWKKTVEEKELKGAPFAKKMVTKTAEGVDIQPLYMAEDFAWSGDPTGFPGFFPYGRGAEAIARTRSGWDIRQEFREPDPAVVNGLLKFELARGVTSAVLKLDASGQAGVAAGDLAGLAAALAGVDLATVPVALEAGAAFLPAATALAALWRQQGVAAPKGDFGADPLGTLAAAGSLPYGVEEALAQVGALAAWTAHNLPGVRAIGVDTAAYHNAGANEAHDLGLALATAVTYLRAAEAAGLSIDQAVGQVAVTLSVGCEEYLQIAKLRAARILWAAVAKASGASDQAARLYLRAKSAERMFSRKDPWVNMLRTTVSTFAAAVGGADAVTSLPFDSAIGLPDEMGRRIARNTQVILGEESHLYRVADPAGGAWSMETLTRQLAEQAWAFFQTIEAKGGLVAALESGFVQETVAATMAERDKAIAKRKTPLTGVSEFPNIGEAPVERPAPDVSGLVAALAARTAGKPAAWSAADPVGSAAAAVEAGAAFAALVAAIGGQAAVTPLAARHLPDAFERLRFAADAYAAKTGALPTIFLANLGPVAKHTARATFSKNFFEAGGIRSLGNNGFTEVAACVAAYRESGARIAILCSADALYEEMVPQFAPALKAAGVETLYLAGSPGDKQEAYDAAGIDDYIFMGADVLGKLTAQLVRLGVIEK